MHKPATFKIDWLKGDAGDVELFRFSVYAASTTSTCCYQEIGQIEDSRRCLAQFLQQEDVQVARFTFGSFERSAAGGAVEIELFRRDTDAELRLSMLDKVGKIAGLDARVFIGVLDFDIIQNFLNGLQGICAGIVMPATLPFLLAGTMQRAALPAQATVSA